MKILQITSSLKRNGTETFIMNLFRNINRHDFIFDFLIFSTDKDGFYDEVLSLGGKIYSLPTRKKGFWNYVKGIRTFFKEHAHEYDAIHWHGSSFSSIAPIYYAKKYGITNIIIHSHSSNCASFHNIILHKFNRLFIPNIASTFLACSEKALEWAYGNTSAFSKAKIIYNGLPLNKFAFNQNSRTLKRKDLNIESSFVIGHVGAFNTIKNHSFLLSVFKEIVKLNSNAILLCVGEGELLNKMISLSKELEIDEKVLFLGRRDDVAQLLQAMDIMIMPSLFEGLPYALIEAQASGLPVFVSSTISESSKITEQFFPISLDESPEKWASIISNYFNASRTAAKNNERLFKFAIENTISEITAIYKDSLNI